MGGEQIPPYRMAQLIKVASGIADKMLNGVWHLSYQEIEIVIDILHTAVEGSRNAVKESEE